MNKTINDDEPAFPSGISQIYGCAIHEGMTLRDYFAGQALCALSQRGYSDEGIAKSAYQIADAMIETKNKAKEIL